MDDATERVSSVMDSRRRRPRQGNVEDGTEDPNTTSLFEEKARAKGRSASMKANKLNAAQLKELEAQKEKEVSQGFHRVQQLWPRMLSGEEEAEREWLVEAEKLVESFRETRNLFQTSRVSSGYLLHAIRTDVFPCSTKGSVVCFPEAPGSRLRRPAKRAWRLAFSLSSVHDLCMAVTHSADSCIGRDTIARKTKADGIDTFRTVSFDEWLRLFLHVCIARLSVRLCLFTPISIPSCSLDADIITLHRRYCAIYCIQVHTKAVLLKTPYG